MVSSIVLGYWFYFAEALSVDLAIGFVYTCIGLAGLGSISRCLKCQKWCVRKSFQWMFKKWSKAPGTHRVQRSQDEDDSSTSYDTLSAVSVKKTSDPKKLPDKIMWFSWFFAIDYEHFFVMVAWPSFQPGQSDHTSFWLMCTYYVHCSYFMFYLMLLDWCTCSAYRWIIFLTMICCRVPNCRCFTSDFEFMY